MIKLGHIPKWLGKSYTVPINLLILIERWFSLCMTCVKWCNVWSSWFTLRCGIRQGGVLSPCLFATYVDDLVNQVKLCGFGCYIRCTCISILLYANNIVLLVPSISALQSLCEKELEWLDMSINVKKSTCLHIGARCNVNVSVLLH